MKQIEIKNLSGITERYTILENFPFTSERKRMGILVKEESSNSLIFYLKGADLAIIPKLDRISSSYVSEECENLAKEGLRTLVISQKIVRPEDYQKWKRRYAEAGKDPVSRDALEAKVIEELEEGMDLLGITGVEDLLQDDVKTVIENLRAAGIKVWMLTGDKLETAKCIAISTGMKAPTVPFLEIKFDPENPTETTITLEKIERNPNQVVIIEGDTLGRLFDDPERKKAFVKYCSMAPSVVCCRCSPTQKSEVTLAIKSQLGKVVCCIGDGGNDVGMIQSASVGIGIEGKEGKQAALAADFSIKNFKTLAPLLLWSGRLSYVRTAKLANFVMHRGLIISVIQYLFSLIFNFTTIQIYNGYLMLGYATVFTSLPIFSLIFDQDVSWRQVFDYPLLYKVLQRGKELSAKTFLLWAWMSVFQGALIITLSITLFETSFLEIITITFTALILIELLNVVSAIHKFHRVIVASLIVSTISYSTCLLFLREAMMLAEVDAEFLIKVMVITCLAWAPIKFGQTLKTRCFPSLLDKVRIEAKEKKKLARSVPREAEEIENLSD